MLLRILAIFLSVVVSMVSAYGTSPYYITAAVPQYIFAPANYFFVDCTNGNDSTGDGSFDAPFLTLTYAASQLSFNGQSQLYIQNGPCTESTHALVNNIDYRGLDAGRVYITNGFSYTASSSTNGQIGLFNLEITDLPFSNVGSGATMLLIMGCKINSGYITNSLFGGEGYSAFIYQSDVTLSSISGYTDGGMITFENCVSGSIGSIDAGAIVQWVGGELTDSSTSMGDSSYLYFIGGDFSGTTFSGAGTGFAKPQVHYGSNTKGTATFSGVAGVNHNDDTSFGKMDGSATISGTTATVTFPTPSLTNYHGDVNPTSSSCSTDMYTSGLSSTGFTVHGANGCTFDWQMTKND